MYTKERHFGYVRVYVDDMFGGYPLVKMDWQVATVDMPMAKQMKEDLEEAVVYAAELEKEIKAEYLRKNK